MTFDTWLSRKELVHSDYLELLKEAYEEGWNSCRDHWGGMEYQETIYLNRMEEDF